MTVLNDGAAGVGGVLAVLVIAVLSIAAYFIPTIIAIARSHDNQWAIAAVNLLLGWSFIGWVVALVWSLTSSEPTQVIVQQPTSAGQCRRCGGWNVAWMPDGTRVCGACGQRG